MSPHTLTFLFPGQGSQSVGMGRDLHSNFAEARQVFEEADDALGYSLSDLCFNGPEDKLKQTEFTQPAILTVSVAAARVLAAKGITAQLAAGHSLGEYSAHVLAGTFSFADAVRTVRARGQFMQTAVPQGQGAMSAVLGLAADRIAELCSEASDEANSQTVEPANMNSPEQTVISGSAAAVEKAGELCKASGARRVVPLPVSAPFHCKLMQPAADELAKVLDSIAFHDATTPIACNVDAMLLTRAAEARDTLIRQVTGAVRWVECIHLLRHEGTTHFIEVGPGKVLSGLNRNIDRALVSFNVEDAASLDKTLAALQA